MRALAISMLCTGCVANAVIEPVDDTDAPIDDTARYELRWLYTALDRMLVMRFDDEAQECAFLVFTFPMEPQPWAQDVSSPDQWAIEAGGARDLLDCDPWVHTPTAPAVYASGWADWGQGDDPWMPGPISMDITMRVDDGREFPFRFEGLEAEF